MDDLANGREGMLRSGLVQIVNLGIVKVGQQPGCISDIRNHGGVRGGCVFKPDQCTNLVDNICNPIVTVVYGLRAAIWKMNFHCVREVGKTNRLAE